MVNKNLLKIASRHGREDLPKQETKVKNLERDSDVKPKIKLTPLEATVVNTRRYEDFVSLMRVYECGGWTWSTGELPTSCLNLWNEYEGGTYVGINDKFKYGKYIYEGDEIISIQEFYEKQNITQEQMVIIKSYFEYSE